MTEHPDDAYVRNLRRLQTEGLDAATEAAIALVRDPKAPSQAKSATINAIFRASGLFDQDPDRDPGNIPPHEMTAEQLSAAIAKLGRRLGIETDDD